MTDFLLGHDWLVKLGALLPLLLIVYLSWRHSRKKEPDPRDLPPMSAEWRGSKDRHRSR